MRSQSRKVQPCCTWNICRRDYNNVVSSIARFIVSFVIICPIAFSSIAPVDRLNEAWWAERHNASVEAAKTHPDTQMLLIGDSITNNYDKAKLPDENFQPTWEQFYAPRKALNLGFSGDTTAHVLWRLQHGEVAGLHPKVALVLIGTNNTGHGETAEETELGIDAVVADLEQRLPETHVLLLGISAERISDSKTQRDRAVNRYLANDYGENPRVTSSWILARFLSCGRFECWRFFTRSALAATWQTAPSGYEWAANDGGGD